jgi:hypothetical protein
MSAHQFWPNWSLSDAVIADPGTGKALPSSRAGYIPIVTGSSGETNTLADPPRPGLLLILHLRTDGGGDRVITAATAIVGNINTTSLTLNDAGDTIVLLSVHDGATDYRWMLLASPGVAAGAALTAALTQITHTAPGTPDYAIQNLVQNTGFGFVTADEGNTVLSVVANLFTRVGEIEARLEAAGNVVAN